MNNSLRQPSPLEDVPTIATGDSCIPARDREMIELPEMPILTDKGLNKALGYLPRPAPQAGSLELGSAIFVARSQRDQTVKDMLEWFVKWLREHHKGTHSGYGHYSIYDYELQGLKEKMAELEGK